MAIQNKKYKSLKYYLDLPWTYSIETAEEKGKKFFIVRVNELPGICTDAPTIPEAFEGIKEAMEAAFKLYMKHEDPIPEPVDQSKFKGKITYQTTSQRHYQIAREAQKKHCSLDQLIDNLVDLGLSRIQK